MHRLVLFLVPAILLIGLWGCALYPELPAGTVKQVTASAILEHREVSIPVPPQDETVPEYRVGPGDVLAVNIPGMANLVSTAVAPSSSTGQVSASVPQTPGYRVYSSGKVLLPLVGGVQVAGLTVDQVQQKLQEVFQPYIKKPVITVEILEYKSQPVYLLGKFNTPGVQYLDRPLTLIQGIALGGGLQDAANLRGARLVRNNHIVPVDIYELMYNDDLRQNVSLHPNDTVYIPGNEQQNVFVVGSVTREGAIPMANGRMTLVQALSTAGLGKQYDPGHIRIIRSDTPTKGELLVVDLGRIMAGDSLPLPLQNGDVIYVPRSGIGDWNAALADMLPSLQAFSAIIQPFVQIKYLTRSN